MNLEEFEQIVSKDGYHINYPLNQSIEENNGYLPCDLEYVNESPFSITIDISSENNEDVYDINFSEIQVYCIHINTIFTAKMDSINTITLNDKYGYPINFLKNCLQIIKDPIKHYCFILNKHIKAVQFFRNNVISKLDVLNFYVDWVKATSVSEEPNSCNSNLVIEYCEKDSNNTATISTDIVTGESFLYLDVTSCDISCTKFILSEEKFDFDKFQEFVDKETKFLKDYETAKINMNSNELIKQINSQKFHSLFDLETTIFGKQLLHKTYTTVDNNLVRVGYTLYECSDATVKVTGILYNSLDTNKHYFKTELI